MRELDKVLDSNEKVLWEGKPIFLPYFFGGVIVAYIIYLVLGIFLFPFLLIPLLFLLFGIIFASTFSIWFLLFIPLLLIVIIFLIFLPGFYIGLVHKNLYYAITDKRAIIQGGLIGRDFKFIDFDKIANADVDVGVFDKMFNKNTGSIVIMSASLGPGSVQMLKNIENPYEVFKFFKKTEFDVKTDINYPNKLRPTVNPGYNIGYKPK